jgi:murein DD-endopeptidase MepM/ murein hydrolase activator NlpD
MASYQPNATADPVVTGTVPASQPSFSHPPASHSAAPPPVSRAVAKAKPAPQPSVHVVAPGETLMKLSRKYNVPLAELARLNNIPPHTKVNIGDRIKLPGGHTAQRAEEPKVAQPKALSDTSKAKPATSKALPKGQAKAESPAAQPAAERVAVASPAAEPAPAADPVRSANSRGTFRWPAKGRIITGFGPKTNGQTNDGINIALPEGTSIHAAQDGTVAYAGNELKGYGNLVLIRHADGYVTAYAHAKELLVRRGETIRRGQTIAKSGQTGNVDAPQLHFEIRKGPAPIDPMPLLNGG